MIKKFGLKKYLQIIIFGVIFLSIASSLFSIFQIKTNINSLIGSIETTNKSSNNIIDLSIAISSIHSALSPMITEKDPDKLEAELLKVKERIKLTSDQLENCLFDCKETKSQFEKYKVIISELIDQKILIGKTAEAIEFFIQDVSPLYLEILNNLEKQSDKIKADSQNIIIESKAQADNLQYSIIGASLILTLLILIGGIRFRNQLLRALTNITEELKESSLTLNSTSAKVATTSDFLSESSTEQNATIQATSQAIQQISQMTEINKNNVKTSSGNAKDSLAKITEGKKAIQQMLSSLVKINESNNRMIEQVATNDKDFSKVISVIKTIDDKTKIINDIVFQTKLLSFNASVEAARAGEHGKGFAVVAEEIGNLAVMSGNAANEISTLLNESVKQVSDIANSSQTSMVSIVELGKATLSDGNINAENCNLIFDKISSQSQDICNFLEEINAGTLEQGKGIEEVNKSMLQLHDVANKSEKVAQESTQMSEKLKDQSGSLVNVVDNLVTMMSGTKS